MDGFIWVLVKIFIPQIGAGGVSKQLVAAHVGIVVGHLIHALSKKVLSCYSMIHSVTMRFLKKDLGMRIS